MQADLRAFIDYLRSKELLLRVEKAVDPKFEIPALMRAAEKVGKAVLFENVKRPGFSLVNNLIGSRYQIACLFEATPETIVNEWTKRIKKPINPYVISVSPVKEVIRTGSDVNLYELPIVTHCEKDNGPYITAGLVTAKDLDTGIRNVSINRMQLKGKNKLGIRMMPPQHLGLIQKKYEQKGKNLEIAVAIGNHPFDILSAATTMAYDVDEFSIAGALRCEPLQLVKCETVDLEVPAYAEIILEGEVLSGKREEEGPFGDFMQYYVPVMQNHIFEVKAITRRKLPIYQTIQAGSFEDTHLLAMSREAAVYEAVSGIAEVKAVSLIPTIMSCMISIKKRSEEEPKRVTATAFKSYTWLKYCVVVDHDVDVFDVGDVWWAMATRSRPDKGILLVEGALGFPRDPFHIHQSKLGIDATAPLNQWSEFERKVIPGAETVNPKDYFL